jgi:hypothetical protein
VDDSKVVGDNLVFEQKGAKLCMCMGKSGTAFERCSMAHLDVAGSQAAEKWTQGTTARTNVDVSYAMSWTDKVVPAGGEYRLLVCGGNPNSALPVTNVDSMTCTATTENVAFEATIHETEQLTGTSYEGILLLQGRGGILIDTQPKVEQLTATNYLVKITVKNPTDVRITDGGLAMSNNLDVVSAGSNCGEIYGNSQGFYFKYSEEIFWHFIVCWTEGLEGDYDASGW